MWYGASFYPLQQNSSPWPFVDQEAHYKLYDGITSP